jgi:hypothetical protein
VKRHNLIFRSTPQFLLYASLTIMPFLGGCAALPISLIAEGADAGLGLASGNARSFTSSRAEVHAATLKALSLMEITVTKDQEKGEKIAMRAKTKHLKGSLTLATITPNLTKVEVKMKRNWFRKDVTVEAEILLQINRALRDANRANNPRSN